LKVIIQRVLSSKVSINNSLYSEIKQGLLVFLGIEKQDNIAAADYLTNKILNLRIFSDNENKMNLSVQNINGELMIISQFTLCTAEKSGNRPSFTNAENPEKAKIIYDYFVEQLRNNYLPEKIKNGDFAKMMKIELINDGPVTIILEKK
jgi:D-aminoacyl-tRNA deacylase